MLDLEAWCHALMGEEERAFETRARARELFGDVLTSAGDALVYTALGREDEALDALEAAYQARLPWLPNVTSYPHFDPLRDHPRFQAMRQGMGL